MQEELKDDAQSGCSEMVGFVSLRSFEVMLQTQPTKTLQYKIKKEHANVSREGLSVRLIFSSSS